MGDSIMRQIFILPHDVKNPNANRRKKRDWTKQPTWEAGSRFLVVTRTYDYSPAGTSTCSYIRSINAWPEVDASTVPELMAALVPAARDLDTVFSEAGLSDAGAYAEVLRRLAAKGAITLGQVEAALAEWAAEGMPGV